VVSYLVYRDLRSRGYVAREGFGAGIDSACTSGANTARTLHPIGDEYAGRQTAGIDELAEAMQQSQNQKKELALPS